MTCAPPITLAIFDNGTGFAESPASKPDMGLRIMKYGADQIGADSRIQPRRGNRGAAVCCVLPPAHS